MKGKQSVVNFNILMLLELGILLNLFNSLHTG